MISAAWNQNEFGTTLRRLELVERRSGQRSALMGRIAGDMADAVAENFSQQGRPRWADLKSVQIRRGAGYKILQVTGRLAASISRSSDDTTARVGTNLVYARIHQFGGRTKAHVIRAKNKRALYTPYGPRKQVNHPGSNIPARPFLSLTERDLVRIGRAGEEFLRSLIA